MMEFITRFHGVKTHCVCLSRANLDALLAGNSVRTNLADLGGPDVEVALLFAETEREIFEELRAAGMIPPGHPFPEASSVESHVVRVIRP